MKLVFPLLACLVLIGCSTTKKESRTSSARDLKILTYNIHHGEGFDGLLNLARIAGIITNSGADLVALQEVDRLTKRTDNIDQAAELAKLTGLHHVFGAAMVFQGGHYGQAVLSRFPIKSSRVHMLPQQPGREPRIALATQIEDFQFISTHLDHELEPIRIMQAEALQKLFGSATNAVILAGDFNSGPTNLTMQTFADWRDAAGSNGAPTIPAQNPSRRIDYILLRPVGAWTVRESKVLDEPVASDHRPVLAIVESQSVEAILK